MLYTKVPCIFENQPIQDYKFLIQCDDELYNRKPIDGSTIYILSPSLEGYDSLESVFETIFTKINIQPADFNEWHESTSLTNSRLLQLVNMLGSNFKLNNEYMFTSGDLYTGVSDAPGVPNRCVIGYNRVDQNSIVSSFSQTSPFVHAAFMQEFENQQFHMIYTLSVLPEACINDGLFDMEVPLDNVVPEDPEDLRKWIANLVIEVWQNSNDFKYNCQVTLTSFPYNMRAISDRYDTKEVPKVYDTNDPNSTNQDPTNPGGSGDGDTNSDRIPVPVLPDDDMTASGSVRIYELSVGELTAFMNYLHSPNWTEAIIKTWQNPIQGVVSLHYLPYPMVPKGSSEQITILGVPAGVGANGTPVKQWQTINFGYCYIGTVKNSYLDYSPYTKVQIYLPGIGIRDLNADDVINKWVKVQYNCDNVTGQFVAFILVGPTKSDTDMSVKYTFSGCVAAPFPISQNNWGNTYIAAATLAAGALAGGVATAGNAVAASGSGAGAAGAAGATETEGALFNAGAVAKKTTNVGNSLTSLAKPSITRAGTVSGTTSLFGVRTPYMIIERPNVQDFKDFNKIKGYACGKTFKLSELSGYTEVERIHLTGLRATASEINEIERLLEGGVIL